MPSLRPSLSLSFWLLLAPTGLPTSGRGCTSPQLTRSPLVFTPFFVLWSSQQYLRLVFHGKFLSLSSFSLHTPFWATPRFRLLCHINYLRLLSGHSGQILILISAACASLIRPHLLVVVKIVWATYPLGVPVVKYGCESWKFNYKVEHRIDTFELWCWRKPLRVPWAPRKSNQSILKALSPECSLEGLMLKAKLQYFGHLMRRVTHLMGNIFPSCWERLRAGGEGNDRGWDGYMASLTQWTWVWINSW